jgi:hypothetical protein
MAKGIKGSGPTEDVPTRTTLIIRPSIIRKLKYIALADGTTQTAIIDGELTDYVAKWEKKNGPIPVK